MSDAKQYWWCLRHSRVETEGNLCPDKFRMGPYATEEEARHAMDKVAERNEEWEAEDKRWDDE